MSNRGILTIGAFATAGAFWMLLNSRYLRFLTNDDTPQLLVNLEMELEQERQKTKSALKINKELLQMLHSSLSQETREGICSIFVNPIPTAMELWRLHVPEIFKHSRHPMDPSFFFHDVTAELLSTVTADRLQRSVKTLPHDLHTVERVVTKAYKRWQFLNGVDMLEEPPKVQILVMGGSVAVGDQCRYKGFPGQMPRRQCAWPFRTVTFLNAILGGEVFELVDAAIGGTNTEAGLTLLEYELLPISHPDIVLHAYSTNDMHLYTIQGADNRNQTLRERVFGLTEEFVRKIMTSCRDTTPLLIHFDDYIGNQQRVILETTDLSQSVQTLANYYGFMSISYPDVVRDLVYGDTRESWFSPAAWYPREKGPMMQEIHPTMGMHITASWILGFNALNLLTHYCSSSFASRTQRTQNETEIEYEAQDGLPLLRGGQQYSFKKPRNVPHGLPPKLSEGLTLDEVSQVWRTNPPFPVNETCVPAKRRCIASWASHLSVNSEAQLNETLSPYLVQNNGWKPVLDFRKLGFVPTGGLHSSFTLEFQNVTQTIKSVTWMVMKSYGEKWSQSLVRMQAHARVNESWSELPLADAEIEGFHDKETSESYSHTIDLGTVEIGSDLRLGMELVGGTTNSTFKIMGMAVCG